MKRKHRWLVSGIFVVAVICGIIGMFSVWVNRQALNTDNWTDTSTKLLADAKIRNVVGAYLVNELFTNVDFAGELQQVLPKQLQALAGPAAGGLRQVAEREAPTLLASPTVQEAWRTANHAAHKQFLTVINGGGKNVSTQNGEVVLNLRSLISQLAANLGLEKQLNAARQQLQGSTGTKIRQQAQSRLGVTLPATAGELVIMRSDQLKTVQSVAKGIRHLAVLFTIIPLALFALGIWLARGWRRVAFRTTGWCFFGIGIAVLLVRRVVGNRVIDTLVASDNVRPAVRNTWTISTQLLYDIAISFVAYGLVFVIAAWLAGPTRSATAVRHALAPALRYRLGVTYGVVALLYLLLLLWGPTPALRKPLGILLFAALIVLGVELLRRQTAREFPDVEEGETMKRWRERASSAWRRRREPAPAPAAAAETPANKQWFDDLDRLADLRERGVLSDEEFTTQKELILNGG